MDFSTVVAIVNQENEDMAIDIAKANGAGGVTILNGRGLGLGDKTTFFGISYERSDAVLIFVVEKHIVLKVIKAITHELDLGKSGSGLVFSLPIENLHGIPDKQLRKFEENLQS